MGRGRLGDLEERREVVSLEKLIKLKNNVNIEKNKMIKQAWDWGIE